MDHITNERRKLYLRGVGEDEVVYQILDAVQHLDHSKTMREAGLGEQADFMLDRARQKLIELLGIHLEVH
ncbi:MAG: hypothetical protein EPN91_01940 [Salinibacterium sp.]|nr:MAG: hypothetical protein EPN91_01940 [Salinibacterium sp.]